MGDRAGKVVVFGVLAVIAAAVGAGVGSMQRAPGHSAVSASSHTEIAEPSDQTTSLEVHVAGWVVSPGVVTVADGAIVADAIDAAGGLRLGARADLINLAARLATGDQIVVPGPEEGGEQRAAGGSAPGDGLISLNQGTAAEFETLPGVGPVLAERIVSHREARGGFDRIEDLLEVPGIGEAKLASMRDLVRP